MLSTVFKNAFKDYKTNFVLNLKTFWWLYILPFIAVTIILSALGFGNFMNINGVSYTSVGIIFSVILFFIGIWFYITLIYASLNNKGKMSFKEASGKSLKYYWRYFGIGVISVLVVLIPVAVLVAGILLMFINWIIGLILILVFIAVLVYVIKVMIRWSLACFALVDKNTGAVESLKSSTKIVKGKGWRVLGYLLLLGLMAGIVYMILMVPVGIFAVIMGLAAPTNLSVIIFTQAFAYIFELIAMFLVLPFAICYMKNIYLGLKKN